MTTEIPSHYRILTSKHEPELLHLSENERKCLLDDFMNLAAIENTDGKESQELFDLSDQILTERNAIKEMDEQIVEIKHRSLEKRKEALNSDDHVEELKRKINNVKKIDGPSYKTTAQSEKFIERLRKSLSKHNRSDLLRKGISDSLIGKNKPSRYKAPKQLKPNDISSFADFSGADLLNACNAIRLYLSLDSGANDVLKCMDDIKKQKKVLEDLIQANEDLAKRKGLTDDNKSLDKKLQEANEKFKKMELDAYKDKEKRIEELAVAETEDELTHGMNPLNPVSMVNFFFGSPSQTNSTEDNNGKVLTKKERQMKKAMENHYATEISNVVGDDKNSTHSLLSNGRGRSHKSIIIKSEDQE